MWRFNMNNKWRQWYKNDLDSWSVANHVYEPLVSMPEPNVFRMNFNNNKYFVNPNMTENLRTEWFQREIKYIEILKNKPYAPEVTHIDIEKRIIEFKWYERSVNILLRYGQLEKIENWQQQIKDILADLLAQDIRKSNLYPHTFYMDDKNQIHIMDLYGCSSSEDRYAPKALLSSIVHDPSHPRFAQSVMGDVYDTFKLYDLTVKMNYGRWPGDFLNA